MSHRDPSMSDAISANEQTGLSRRSWLRGAAMLIGAASVLPATSALATPLPTTLPVPLPMGRSERRLSLINVNTRESFDGVFWRDGRYVEEALRQLNVLLRDHRAGKVAEMDRALFDQLYVLHQNLGSRSAFKVISAYRSDETNAAKRKKSRRVARNSYHCEGMAIDVCLDDVRFEGLYKTAIGLRAGGVGRYRRDGFVHVDTGPVRSW